MTGLWLEVVGLTCAITCLRRHIGTGFAVYELFNNSRNARWALTFSTLLLLSITFDPEQPGGGGFRPSFLGLLPAHWQPFVEDIGAALPTVAKTMFFFTPDTWPTIIVVPFIGSRSQFASMWRFLGIDW